MTTEDIKAGPLSGVRVIDVTTTLLGPMATVLLGDLGADVIKIERPTGDPTRQIGPHRNPGMGPYFMQANRNKKSVVLDLTAQPGRDALNTLIAGGDVFVHNMRRKAAIKLGLDYDSVRKLNPEIIYAAGASYNQKGPRKDLAAYDDVIQGQSGMAALNRTPQGEPRYFPMAFVDKYVGTMLGSMIIAALYSKAVTGKGQEVSVPMLETTLHFSLVEHLWGKGFVPPVGASGYPRMKTPYRRPYPTKDGHISVLAHTDEQYVRLFSELGLEHMRDDPRYAKQNARNQNIADVYKAFGEAYAKMTTAEVIEVLKRADIPGAPMAEMDDLFEDPYLLETGFFKQMDHPTEGKVITTSIPFAFSETPTAIRYLAPNLGANTDEVLGEIGLDAAAIEAATGAKR